MSEPYVFQYDTLDGKKRPLRRGIIVLEMPHESEKLELSVHADALAGCSGLINRIFEEFVDDSDDSVCDVKEKSSFPIPSFPPALLDEFLCNAYGKVYVHPRERAGAGIASRSETVLAGIDMAVFFDATDPHFARLDDALFEIVRSPGYSPDHSEDVFIDILLHVEPLAARLPKSWTQSLKNVVMYANAVATDALTLDPTATFPTEVALHPTFKLLRESTREKIAWALVRNYHEAWRVNAQRRKTATHAQFCEIVNELVPRFIEGSHEFTFDPIDPCVFPIRAGHRKPETYIQLLVECPTSPDESKTIRVYVILSGQCTCRVHADLAITYADGTVEAIKTPPAGVYKCKRFSIGKASADIKGLSGTIRVDYCDS